MNKIRASAFRLRQEIDYDSSKLIAQFGCLAFALKARVLKNIVSPESAASAADRVKAG